MTYNYPQMTLKPHRDETILRGHPWIFSGGLRLPIPVLAAGTIVDVFDIEHHFVARGYYNPQTDIAIRILTRQIDETIDLDFFRRRIRDALAIREPLTQDTHTTAYRLVNAEGDQLPGAIVDRYGDVLVIQISTAGMEQLTPLLIEALHTEIPLQGILLRNDVTVRTREGMERERPVVAWGDVPPIVEIIENGMRFQIDVYTGQKTGFFLDQRDKRRTLQRYAKGKTVLNTFSYTGGFGIAALQAGAVHITNVDQSGPVIAQAREQMTLNGFDPDAHEFGVGDAFAMLERWAAEDRRFDIVILDPPAFAKNINSRTQAMRAYRRLNMLGMQVLQPGGLLVTCSCSGPITLEEFRIIISESGQRTGRVVRTAESFEHGLDHPVLLAMPEARYLKVLFCRVS